MFQRRKPDLVIILAIVVGVSILVSNATVGQAHPEAVAQSYLVR